MRALALLVLLIPCQALAKAPECPVFSTKHECFKSVEDNYQKFLDYYLGPEEDEEKKNKLILAATDIKHFETLACSKTCAN